MKYRNEELIPVFRAKELPLGSPAWYRERAKVKTPYAAQDWISEIGFDAELLQYVRGAQILDSCAGSNPDPFIEQLCAFITPKEMAELLTDEAASSRKRDRLATYRAMFANGDPMEIRSSKEILRYHNHVMHKSLISDARGAVAFEWRVSGAMRHSGGAYVVLLYQEGPHLDKLSSQDVVSLYLLWATRPAMEDARKRLAARLNPDRVTSAQAYRLFRHMNDSVTEEMLPLLGRIDELNKYKLLVDRSSIFGRVKDGLASYMTSTESRQWYLRNVKFDDKLFQALPDEVKAEMILDEMN